MQSDGCKAYDHYECIDGVICYNCWVHARRYFFDAIDNDKDRAEYALTIIKKLCAIERQIRGRPPDERAKVREEEARSILGELKAWLLKNEGLPKSARGKAVCYSLGRWDKLTRYVEDGRVEIDNNLIGKRDTAHRSGEKKLSFCWIT